MPSQKCQATDFISRSQFPYLEETRGCGPWSWHPERPEPTPSSLQVLRQSALWPHPLRLPVPRALPLPRPRVQLPGMSHGHWPCSWSRVRGQLWALCGCPCSFPSSLSLPRALVTLGVEFFQMLFCITYRLIWFFFHRPSVWWVIVKVFTNMLNQPCIPGKSPLSAVYFLSARC